MIIGDLHRFYWMMRSHSEQKRAWRDAAEARVSRRRAEEQAAAQLKAMLAANPSGQLGSARLNDEDALDQSGLL